MTTRPTAEESARYILSIYRHHKCLPSHALSARNFTAPFGEFPWSGTDYKPGMEYAIDKKWIEVGENGWLKLTDDGFAELPEG
jgi:hypothetical protein